MPLQVKVCGLTEAECLQQAVSLGAAYVGFIFFPPSPRFVPPERAGELAALVEGGTQTVGVLVDASDEFIDHILSWVPLDVLQLHGHETPERVAGLATRTGLKVMKAIRVEGSQDLEPLPAYAEAADMILFDAKPPRDAAWPGGHGLPFDWRLLEDIDIGKPWALAGGLGTDNLEAAVRLVHPPIVDVSSGVEASPGIKDPRKLEAFLKKAADLAAASGDCGS
jgi:phosphoribosylanthranilate isomerase